MPENLRQMAKLGSQVVLVGIKSRIDIYDEAEFDKQLGLDAGGEVWPAWTQFLHMPPRLRRDQDEAG